MVKIILTSHGGLCQGILESFSMLAGTCNFLTALPLKPDDTGEYKEKLKNMLSNCKNDDVLILCDIMGGTPYNEGYAAFLQNPEKIRVVSGLNLGMLLETALAAENDTKLNDLASIAIDAGHKSIKEAKVDTDKDQEIIF